MSTSAIDTTASRRLDRRFAAVRAENRAALVTYITAGDPGYDASLATFLGMADAGADVIELGMPFTDPMADGLAIQHATQRALKAGQTMDHTLAMVSEFRKRDQDTPIVLMGYYNPIYRRGVSRFLEQASEAGVDGLIVVDLPPEHDDELCVPANEAGISFIRLATPTTDSERLPGVLANTSGFLYYVSSNGVTGGAAPTAEKVEAEVGRIREHTDIPVAVGFGIRTAEQAARIGRFSDGVVVGSALIDLQANAETPEQGTQAVHALTRELADALKTARQ
ncbi:MULTISPECIES: tryptophan synthase subunit alpha [Cobetia]|uniref:tryptophan synthase subunit alpha n=1 Tax=Cobetia TaxID=204286 RepID=UPI0015815D91|nr:MULTISPECIES: tryptophan synthase subunit alpha [Cobetia]MDI4660654.1 tryptophan synthase subunit alpha [Cobetia sp. BMC6]MDL2190148.1 tryptophan synthase subunit alpha [Cobetia sp. LC6]NUJ54711.1 tryptophan synthase subunit alpha [Cobetia marina]